MIRPPAVPGQDMGGQKVFQLHSNPFTNWNACYESFLSSVDRKTVEKVGLRLSRFIALVGARAVKW